ncbi:MAG: hypothetical protein OXO56_05525, partial [Gammaproteobacteria bacterium]|nr:hypothetical protein [Gammaproteobacteria bacterium]
VSGLLRCRGGGEPEEGDESEGQDRQGVPHWHSPLVCRAREPATLRGAAEPPPRAFLSKHENVLPFPDRCNVAGANSGTDAEDGMGPRYRLSASISSIR